jgi:hypothetical protein
MALKILTREEDMPDAQEKLQRVYAYTNWFFPFLFFSKSGKREEKS